MAIDVLGAMIDTLASHLETNVSGIEAVMRSWPDPRTKIEYPSISIVTSSPVARLRAPEQIDESDGDDDSVIATYRIGNMSVGIQIDVWTRSATHRGEYQNKVIDALMSQVESYSGSYPSYRSNSGLYLAMSNYHNLKAGYSIKGFRWQDTEDSGARREFRSLVELDSRADIVVLRTQPKMTKMTLDWRVGTQTLEDLAALPEEVQIIFE